MQSRLNVKDKIIYACVKASWLLVPKSTNPLKLTKKIYAENLLKAPANSKRFNFRTFLLSSLSLI